MFCPNCGLERASTATSFCSRCGFLLTGTAELMQQGGVMPKAETSMGFRGRSPRSRGLKQGLFIFLLSFLIVPLAAIFTVAVNAEPYLVVISAIILTVGGLLRMAYALMFESSSAIDLGASATELSRPPNPGSLPAGSSIPAHFHAGPGAGKWRDTNDLAPASVTDGTTKLLDPEERS